MSSRAGHWGLFRSTGPTDLKIRASPPGLNFSADPPGLLHSRPSISVLCCWLRSHFVSYPNANMSSRAGHWDLLQSWSSISVLWSISFPAHIPICHPVLTFKAFCRAGHKFLCYAVGSGLRSHFVSCPYAFMSSRVGHWGLFRSTGPTDLKSSASPPGLNFSAGPLGPQLMRSSSRLQLPASIALLAPGKSCHKFSRLTNIDKVPKLPWTAISWNRLSNLSKVVKSCQKVTKSWPPNLNRWASTLGFNYVAVAQTLQGINSCSISCHKLP